MPTDAALAVTRLVHAFNKGLEARYRRLLGARAYASLRAALKAVAPPGGTLQPRIP